MQRGDSKSNLLDINDEETSELFQCKGVLIINSQNQQTIAQPIEVEFVPRNDGNNKTIYECHVSRLKSTNNEEVSESSLESYLPSIDAPGSGLDDSELISEEQEEEEEEETSTSEDTSTSSVDEETTLSSDLGSGITYESYQSEDANNDEESEDAHQKSPVASPITKSIATSTEEDDIFTSHRTKEVIIQPDRFDDDTEKPIINSPAPTIKAIRIKRTGRLFGNIKEINLLLSDDSSESPNTITKKRKSSKANRKYSYYDLDLLDKKRLELLGNKLSPRLAENFLYDNRESSVYASRIQHRFIPDDESGRRKMIGTQVEKKDLRESAKRLTIEKSTNVDDKDKQPSKTRSKNVMTYDLDSKKRKTDASTSISTVKKLSENPEICKSVLRYEIAPSPSVPSNRNFWKPQECLSGIESKSSKFLMQFDLEKNSNEHPALCKKSNKVFIALQKNKSQLQLPSHKHERIIKRKDEETFPETSFNFTQSVHVLHSKDEAILKKSVPSKDRYSKVGTRHSLAKFVRMESHTSVDSRKRKISGYLFHTPIRRIRSRTIDLFVRPMDFFEHPKAKNTPDDQLDPKPLLRIIESKEVFKKTVTEQPKPGDARVPQESIDEKFDFYDDHENEDSDWVSPGELIRQQKLANLKQYQNYRYVIYANEKTESETKLVELETVYNAKEGKKPVQDSNEKKEAKSQEKSKEKLQSKEDSKSKQEPKSNNVNLTKENKPEKVEKEPEIEKTKPKEEPVIKDVKGKKVSKPKETSSKTEETKLKKPTTEIEPKLEEPKPKEAQKPEDSSKVKEVERQEESKPITSSLTKGPKPKEKIITETEPKIKEIKPKEEARNKDVKNKKISKPNETSNLQEGSKPETQATENEPKHEVKPKEAPAPASIKPKDLQREEDYKLNKPSSLTEKRNLELSINEMEPKLEEAKSKAAAKPREPLSPPTPKYKEDRRKNSQKSPSSTERLKLEEKQTKRKSITLEDPKSKEVIYKETPKLRDERKIEENEPTKEGQKPKNGKTKDEEPKSKEVQTLTKRDNTEEQIGKEETRAKRKETPPPPPPPPPLPPSPYKEMGETKPNKSDEQKPEEETTLGDVSTDKGIKKRSIPHFKTPSGTMQAAAKQKDNEKIKNQASVRDDDKKIGQDGKEKKENKSAKFHTASQEDHHEHKGGKINVVFTKDKKESETELKVPMKIVFK